MLKFLHGYAPELWEGYKKHGLLREQDGIRFMQNFLTPDEFRFNKLAAKDSELYNLIKEENRPFYIDRLQGGCFLWARKPMMCPCAAVRSISHSALVMV